MGNIDRNLIQHAGMSIKEPLWHREGFKVQQWDIAVIPLNGGNRINMV